MKHLKVIILLLLSNSLIAQTLKIDSTSYEMGILLSDQVKMIEKRLSLTDTKLNKKAYLLGLNSVINSKKLKLTEEKQIVLLKSFSQTEGDLVREKKKSKNLKISKNGSIKTLMDSVSYSLGIKFAHDTKSKYQQFEKDLKIKINKKKLTLGYADGIKTNQTEFDKLVKKSKESIVAFHKYRLNIAYKKNKVDGEKYLSDNKKKKGVKTTKSGLQYIVIKEGKGNKPVATSKVKVHYHGTLIDGTVFDSSVVRKGPATFPLNSVIKGWTEGLQLMTPGSKYKLYIPYSLAYEDRIVGSKIEPFSTLIFEIELLEVLESK